MNTFSTLFFRAHKLCSTYEAFHSEVCFLKNFFRMNGYTENLFFKKLRTFLNNIYIPSIRENGPRKLNLYFRIPYFRDNTNKTFKEEITKVLNKYFPQIKSIPVFFNNTRIKVFTNHKEKIAPSSESMIVYGYTCSSCQQAYVGSSKKILLSRIHDHRGTSIRTGRPLSSPMFSAIRTHSETSCENNINTEDFKLLYKGKSELEIRIAESMLIKKLNPELNNDLSSFPLKFWL